jgi:aspartate carbamoyltransferase regulatory subunit
MEEIDNSNNNKKRKIEHKCSYCEKTYKKLCKLAEHERSHTGEVGLFV